LFFFLYIYPSLQLNKQLIYTLNTTNLKFIDSGTESHGQVTASLNIGGHSDEPEKCIISSYI